ncbi:MAG TPA: type II toxin-antitoxin system HicB family antitoxin [Erysipelotrichaceae bacterium]|jgi:antitoxin HicB|nr:type II toxin-antitoxin system HicB family antitoxin [Erysipelotrichia bacterium]HPX32412.1 type II toxin-antitoxin system HicB family antitoxin [Erysipelotrichaceae bacterium]HQA85067.1 type II toxin-antitoxin system HicB family antitoxin [Erysipelotrichaceae bacterium]
MSIVYYPSVFHEEDGSYWVEFPDLDGCFSSGKTIEETFENAKEALGIYLDKEGELFDRKIKKPSSVEKIKMKYPNELIMLIEYNSLEYAKKFKTKAVKKTLTIPQWLNDYASNKNVNFSNVLQEALLNKFNL